MTSVIPAYNFSSAHLSRAPGPKHCIMCAGPCTVLLMYATPLFLSTALRSTEPKTALGETRQKNCWGRCSGESTLVIFLFSPLPEELVDFKYYLAIQHIRRIFPF